MLILLALLLQADPSRQPGSVTDITLEHVRRALELDESRLSAPPPGVPVFRMKIIERHLDFQRPWDDDGVVPSYVHTRAPLYHHEFLYAVTPEAFQSATLYPVGVPLMPAIDALQRAVRRGVHSHNEARARRMVQKELEHLKADSFSAPSAGSRK